MLWVFDNDETLYDARAAHAEFLRILADYVVARRSCSVEEAAKFVHDLKAAAGAKRSSAFVLSRAFGLPPEEIIRDTYLRIDLGKCVPREDAIRQQVLSSIPEPKVVLTNGPSEYCRKVLRHTGLDIFFGLVFGECEVGFHLKPDRFAFEVVMKAYPSEKEIVLVDDSCENLDVARSLGWKTIWLQTECGAPPGPDSGHAVAASFEAIAQAIALV